MAIDDPFYTYCANHPHRRPDRDPIPIGPITRHQWNDGSEARVIWRHSPDTEEIRLHLLKLLDGLFEHTAKDRYPIGHSLAQAIIWQLGQFKEQRAVPASSGSATTSTAVSPITPAPPWMKPAPVGANANYRSIKRVHAAKEKEIQPAS